jgi:hypothetical protein
LKKKVCKRKRKERKSVIPKSVGLVITVKQQLTLGAAKKRCRYAHTAYLWGNHNFAFAKKFSLLFLLHLPLNF